jgi:predicted ester cyclase
MSLEENKAVVRRWHDEFQNKGNVDVIDELIDAKCVLHIDPQPTDVREHWKQGHATFRAAFSDAHLTNEDMIAEGDKVVTRWTWRVKHTGEWMGIAPTGKQVEITGISIHRIAGGKIVEDWASADELGMMQQLGAIPVPGE